MARLRYPVRTHITMDGKEFKPGSAIVLDDEVATGMPWAVDLTEGRPEDETPPDASKGKGDQSKAKAEPPKGRVK